MSGSLFRKLEKNGTLGSLLLYYLLKIKTEQHVLETTLQYMVIVQNRVRRLVKIYVLIMTVDNISYSTINKGQIFQIYQWILNCSWVMISIGFTIFQEADSFQLITALVSKWQNFYPFFAFSLKDMAKWWLISCNHNKTGMKSYDC